MTSPTKADAVGEFVSPASTFACIDEIVEDPALDDAQRLERLRRLLAKLRASRAKNGVDGGDQAQSPARSMEQVTADAIARLEKPNPTRGPVTKPGDLRNPARAAEHSGLLSRLLIAAIIIATFLAGLAYFQFALKPSLIKSAISKNAPPPATVTAEQARDEQWVTRVNSVGTLISIQSIDVAAQVAGIVSSLTFESGDVVKAGQPLLQLDSSVEQADLASNKAALMQSELDFARKKELVGRDVASRASFEDARAKRDSAVAAVQRVEALIGQKTIKAAFSGRIGLRKVELGQYIAPGMALSTLQQLDPIRVDFPVPQQEVRRLAPGQALELTVDAVPGREFRGEIETLDARVSPESRMLVVRGRLGNPGNELLPGMFADVRVLVGTPAKVVTVARTAITYSPYGDTIYVVTSARSDTADSPDARQQPVTGSVVERRLVRIGDTRGDRTQVTDGLAAGELVVTSGQLKLNPGAAVVVDNSERLSPLPERPRQ